MDQNEYNEFFSDFLTESIELLQSYEKNLLEAESAYKESNFSFEMIEENLQSIFRSVHTIKGIAGMMDFNDVKNYSHEAEDILKLASTNQIVFDDALIDLMFDILDTMKKLIENVLTPDRNPFDLQEEVSFLKNFMERAITSKKKGEATKLSTQPQIASKSKSELTKFSSGTIRVDTQLLDDLLNIVGEMVIGKNELVDISKSIKDIRLGKSIKNFKRLVVNLQEWSMKLRMVPIGYTFNKFKRLVRDLSREKGKEVNLVIEGETTELDRAIIESMEDPLLHLIRNSIDHGIETPDERIQKGKTPAGSLKLSAFQQNNAIEIHVEDDGKGLDAKKIYQKAVEKGLIEKDLQLSQKEIFNLIFLPGFSTAKKVTDVSGRGVGMDVVRKNITKLNGMVDIESELDKGTKFILTLPLTLAIIRVLLVRIGDETFSIPITNISETFAVTNPRIQHINEHEAIQVRNSLMPIIRLRQILGIKTNGIKEKAFMVVAKIRGTEVGFIVDELINQQDIVIKPLGKYLGHIYGISGATILGNGEVSLVLDLASFWEEEISRFGRKI